MAIAAVNGSTVSNATAGTSLAFAAASQTSGNRIVVAVAILNVAVGVSSISDGTNTYTGLAAFNNGSNVRVELWSAPIGSSATRTITITLSGSSLASAAYEQYSGSTGVGNISSSLAGSNTYPESDVQTQDTSSWSVAALSVATNSGDTFNADLGTIRQSVVPALTTAAIALVDNTSIVAVPGLRNVARMSTARNWVGASIELRTGVAATAVTATNIRTPSTSDTGAGHQIVKTFPGFSNAAASSGGNSGFSA